MLKWIHNLYNVRAHVRSRSRSSHLYKLYVITFVHRNSREFYYRNSANLFSPLFFDYRLTFSSPWCDILTRNFIKKIFFFEKTVNNTVKISFLFYTRVDRSRVNRKWLQRIATHKRYQSRRRIIRFPTKKRNPFVRRVVLFSRSVARILVRRGGGRNFCLRIWHS